MSDVQAKHEPIMHGESPREEDRLVHLVEDHLRPQARAIDEQGVYPKDILKKIASSGGVFSPLAQASSTRLMPTIRAGATVAKACGATAFCMWCQSALIWYLRNTENTNLKNRYLKAAVHGDLLGGTGLSNPMKVLAGLEKHNLRGQEKQGKLYIRGFIPWVSNVEAGHPFGAVFSMPEGPAKMALLFAESKSDADVRFRENDQFVVLQGTATVTVAVNALIDDSCLLTQDADRFLPKIRTGFVLLQLGIGLGLIAESHRLIATSGRQSKHATNLGIIKNAQELIDIEERLWDRLHVMLARLEGGEEPSVSDLFRLRLDTALATLHAAQSAQLHLGAGGLALGSRVSRLSREAAFFSVLTPSVRHLDYVLSKQP